MNQITHTYLNPNHKINKRPWFFHGHEFKFVGPTFNKGGGQTLVIIVGLIAYPFGRWARFGSTSSIGPYVGSFIGSCFCQDLFLRTRDVRNLMAM